MPDRSSRSLSLRRCRVRRVDPEGFRDARWAWGAGMQLQAAALGKSSPSRSGGTVSSSSRPP